MVVGVAVSGGEFEKEKKSVGITKKWGLAMV